MSDPEAVTSSGAVEAELRRRLAEAEDTLRAIREGEVDALVMRGADQDEVFALGGQDSYRYFMEAMDTGAAALDASNKVIYANASLCTLLGRSARDLQRDGIFAALGPRASQVLRALVADPAQTRRSRQITMPFADGFCHVEVSVAPLALGFGQGHALTFTDVTERVEATAASESDRIGQAIMATSSDAVMVCNRDGVITQANAGVRQFAGGPVIGRSFDEVFPFTFELRSGVMAGGDLIASALAGTAVRGIEAGLYDNGQTRELVLSASPLRQSSDTIFGCIVSVTDVTERRAIDKRQSLLVSELTHRVKNTLTLVMSIANRTIKNSQNLGDFRVTFGRRIQALAATHSLLAEGAWGSLTIAEVVNVELAPYISPGSQRLNCDGLDVPIAPDAAVAVGLILHELVTNAVKYGALSVDEGRISIQGRLERDAIKIDWEESGGPPVEPPQRSGFGQTLIARGLGENAAQSTEVQFRPEGLVCRMSLRIDGLVNA
jgi:PAS domain S-box-containing protein